MKTITNSIVIFPQVDSEAHDAPASVNENELEIITGAPEVDNFPE